MTGKLTRREMLRLSAIVGAGTLAAACGAATPTVAPTAAPAATAASAATATTAPAATVAPAATATTAPAATAASAATATTAPAAAGGDVPRNRTFIVMWGGVGGKYTNMGVTNPIANFDHQDGGALLWDPLWYYSVFADKEIPWLAESGEYNKDFTQLTIKLRKGAEWSDGKPITSADVKFTWQAYAGNEKAAYNAQFKEFVKDVQTPDDSTAIFTFNGPQSRFKFEVLSFKFDTGVPVLPMHVLKDEKDVVAFQGGDNMPHSGMFNVKMAPEQHIYDIRKDWWGFKTGFQKMPDMQRALFLPLSGDMSIAAQKVVNNEADSSLDLRAALIRTAVQSNPKITTHTGKDEPLGYRDWWPNSLWVNTQLDPYSNPDVRWAMNYAIDRDTIDKVVYLGAKIATIYPYPEYPALKKYLDATKPISDQLGVRTFDLNKTAERMTKAGFKKDADGFWVKDGKRINATIDGFESIHGDLVPVLVEMLRKGGFEAAPNFGNDAGQNMADGKPGLYLFGHGASVIDPYATLELYHSKFASPIGTAAGNGRFSRYKNPDFDKLADGIRALAPGDPGIPDLFNKAMTIYWTDMIDIPIIQWLHRIPYNQTYWTNYPTQDNPYLNGAFWHWTFPLLVLGLKAAQ